MYILKDKILLQNNLSEKHYYSLLHQTKKYFAKILLLFINLLALIYVADPDRFLKNR